MAQVPAILETLSLRLPPGYDLTLGRIERLLAALGNPHHRLPPVIHVAGTNGKGSTIAFMRAMLEADGKRVHTHTSPHLVHYNERYRLATGPGTSQFVSNDAFADTLQRADAANGGEHVTLFEVMAASGFLLMSETPADVVLLEVGLGGRLDATNVITSPLVSVITSISLDHMRQLGDTVEKIAFEKAGIIKAGRPVVVSANRPSVIEVFEKVALEKRAPLTVGGQDFTIWQEHNRLVYQDEQGLMDLPLPKLPGRHQLMNAGTAIAALSKAGLLPAHEIVEQALSSVDWPARLTRLTHGKLVDEAVPGAEIWLDGAHNPGGSEAAASAMADLEEKFERPLFVIASMLNTKDPQGFFAPFRGLARHVFTVPIHHSESGRDPKELAEAARAQGLSADAVSGVREALRRISFGWRFEPAPRILICGTLYLAGEVLEENGTPPV